MADEGSHETQGSRVPKDSWPEAGTLSKLFEADAVLRRRAREKGHISRWPNLACTGVPSCKAMALNTRALEIIAEWFCPSQQLSTYIPIELMRREVSLLWNSEMFQFAV